MKREHFDQVYEDYHKLVLHIAFDGLRDHSLAQDVCQEVFCKLHEKIDGLDEELIQGWIVRNAHRKTIDFLRRAYLKNEVYRDIDEAMLDQKLFDAGLAVEYLVAEEEQRRAEFRSFLLARLKEKNPVWYDLMIRVVIGKESTKAVAQDHNMTVVNLRMKISRARRWLYKNYYQDYQDL